MNDVCANSRDLQGKPLEDDASFAPPAVTPCQAKLLKRSEAARLLGVSTATVRRMEGTTLTPVLGADGVHRFHEEHVREIVIHRVRMVPESPDAYDAKWGPPFQCDGGDSGGILAGNPSVCRWPCPYPLLFPRRSRGFLLGTVLHIDPSPPMTLDEMPLRRSG